MKLSLVLARKAAGSKAHFTPSNLTSGPNQSPAADQLVVPTPVTPSHQAPTQDVSTPTHVRLSTKAAQDVSAPTHASLSAKAAQDLLTPTHAHLSI
eukprot:11497032-Ditylum_brightwellii.AAC.1